MSDTKTAESWADTEEARDWKRRVRGARVEVRR
jgi:hypothetical protein